MSFDGTNKISSYLKEIEKIKKLEESGKRKEATVANGRLLKKISSEIKSLELRDEIDVDNLEDVKKMVEMLESQLDWHKNQLNSRYRSEFLNQKATLKAIVTVLPKGIALQVQKVVSCINKLKEARTNKQKIFGVLDAGKELRILAATPVIFGGKFVVEHWYLLLLLLLLIKFPGLSLSGVNSKIKSPNQEFEPSPEKVSVAETSSVPEQSFEGVLDHNTVSVVEPEGSLGTSPVVIPSEEENVIDNVSVKPSSVVTNSGVSSTNVIKPSVYDSKKGSLVVPEPNDVGASVNFGLVDITEVDAQLMKNISNDFINSLETNYNFFIAENHPDVQVVNSASEYVMAVKTINPSVNITEATAEQFYLRNMTYGTSTTQAIVWPNIDNSIKFFDTNEALLDYIISGEDKELNNYLDNYVKCTDNLGEYQYLSDKFHDPNFEFLVHSLGISTSSAVVLFVLYEAFQVGLLTMGPAGMAASALLPG